MTDEFIRVLAQSLTATMDMEDAKRLARSIMSKDGGGAEPVPIEASRHYEVDNGSDQNR